MERVVNRVATKEQEQMADVVDRAVQIEQEDATDVAEQPVETVCAEPEEVAPTQEPRRSGRVRKTNVKYDEDTWDLS